MIIFIGGFLLVEGAQILVLRDLMLELSRRHRHHHMIGYFLCDGTGIFGAVGLGKHLV
jgi:hypothetical protein